MADAELAARLIAHEHAFEGLLDLIPAKFYNPEDAANQWNKRKQSKEEAGQAKRAKLDPNQNSRQKKQSDNSTQTSVGIPNGTSTSNKKQKKRADGDASSNAPSTKKKPSSIVKANDVPKTPSESMNDLSSTISKSADSEAQVETTNNEAQTKQPDRSRNIAELRARLAAKIEAMRSKRKAPGSGVDGAPHSRTAILEARRKKEEIRAERRRAEREAQKAIQKEATSAQDSDADDAESSIESDEISSETDDVPDLSSIAYGKVEFGDGDLLGTEGNAHSARKRKQQDSKSALQVAINKKTRLSALPSDKQSKIRESDSWHRALLQADGEKIKDDVSLLKKAVKRKEGMKKKSEKEWKERLSSIAKAKALRQKNREQNLKDRRDSKGKAGGHKKGKQIGAFQGKAKNNKNKKGF